LKGIRRTKKPARTDPKKEEMLEEALGYWRLGLNVFPIEWNLKTPDPQAGKWEAYQEVKETERMIQDWFGGHICNIAIICGAISGNLVVVDFDDEKIFNKVMKKSHKFAEAADGTMRVKTSKGRHIYFRTPNTVRGFKIPTLTIDIKGESGYVLAPPSKHPSGKFYEFEGKQKISRNIEIKNLDEPDFRAWLLDALDGIEGFKAKDLREEIDIDKLLLGCEEGNRNTSCFIIASFFRVKKKFTKEKAWEQIKLWNEKNTPPLEEEELQRTLNSAYDRDEPCKYRFKGGQTELYDPETVEAAEELLKKEDILTYIAHDALKDVIGYVEQKVTLFLLNLMKESVQVLGDTSTGKSHMCDRVFWCFPRKSYFKITGVTDKAIRYLAESIRHLYLAEWQAIGGGKGEESTAAFDVKLVISEGKLTILVVERDEETGRMQTRLIETAVENIISTTTKVALPPELLNRIWEVTTDKALTPQVVQFEIKQATLPPEERITCAKERRVLRCAVEQVEREAPRKFVIPYFGIVATRIFEKLWTEPRASRDVKKLRRLIEASAYLHYKTRPILGEGENAYIVCLPDDFYHVALYGKDAIIGTFTGETKRYVEIKEVVKRIAKDEKEISAETLAMMTGLSRNRAQSWLRRMANEKFVLLDKKKGKAGRRVYVWAEEDMREEEVEFNTAELYPSVEAYLNERRSGAQKCVLQKKKSKNFKMRFRATLQRSIADLPDAEQDDDIRLEKEY